ncbi:MAG: hypothetical protein HKUEN02_22070 [Anaerolineaceae bacterium]|nr:MAG: hypothetical protein HKUEN02_22070 [Anaerolineaceae bacterium]
MDWDTENRIKGSFFVELNDVYTSAFDERRWGANNWYIERLKPEICFSWNWANMVRFVAEIQIRNKNGGDILYKYLEENARSPKSFEWFVMPGMSRIIWEIEPEVDLNSLANNDDYREYLIYAAIAAMKILEEEFRHLINKYFEEYSD